MDLSAFLGHLHPLIVHLPIGFLILAVAFEFLSFLKRYEALKRAVPFVLLLGFISATFAALFGYLLAQGSGYDLEILSDHQLYGILLAVVSGILYLFTFSSIALALGLKRRTFSVLMLIMFFIVCYTGHLGGSLTHGKDYISFDIFGNSTSGKIEGVENVLRKVQANADLSLPIDLKALDSLRAKGVVVRIMLHAPLQLDVTMPSGSGIKISQIEGQLRSIAKVVIWLNLSGNGLTDQDVEFLPLMTNLEKLRLEKNPITDHIVGQLKGLEKLQAVNLNDTKITTVCLDQLKQMPNLKRVYSWHTVEK
jgi:uncharacterized membrane protein